MKTPRFRFLFTLVAILGLALAGPIGCQSTLDPSGVYQGDRVLYNADKAITTAYKSFDSFLKWELAYRENLPVEVSRAADSIRANAKKWIDSASALRDGYANNPTKETKSRLETALSVIEAGLDDAAKYMSANRTKAPPTN